MTIEAAIVERLRDLAAVSALVSTRVYQLILPQGVTLPAIRVQRVSTMDELHLRGPVRVQTTRMQVDAYATTYAVASDVAEAVHGDGLGDNATGLHGFVGDLGGSPAALHIAYLERVEMRPEYEPDELKLFRIRQDYRVLWWVNT